METLISSRLFGHFAETFREGKTITENKVTDAYGEFISQLSLLANGEQSSDRQVKASQDIGTGT